MSNRIYRLSFRVNEHELSTIHKRASMANMTHSDYLRHSALNHKINIIKGLDDFNKQLCGIGRNLNQLTRLCNQGRLQCLDLKSIRRSIADIAKSINQLGQ